MNYLQLPDAVFPYIRRWSGMQLAVWCDVYTMTVNGRAYYRTNDQLAELFGTDPRTVRRLVQDLVKEGALSTRMDGRRRILTANKIGSWNAPVKERRTDMSEDRNDRGQIYPRTDMSAKEDRNVRDGGQKCPLKEDRNVPQIDKVIENRIEKRIEKKQKAKLVEVILPWDTDTFAEAWDQWKEYKRVEHRFSFKGSMSEQTSLHQLSNLAGGSEATAIAIIGHSIANGYKGLFPPGRGATPTPQQRMETLRGAVEILSQMK